MEDCTSRSFENIFRNIFKTINNLSSPVNFIMIPVSFDPCLTVKENHNVVPFERNNQIALSVDGSPKVI